MSVQRPWSDVFDRVYVVSLPEATERRAYVARHLEENGITRFEWHDAAGPNHPQVRHAFASGRVQRFPPCFRCGRTACGDDDCNNVLIPSQVAVFVSYLNLWMKIASRSERALVVEDDVRLHDTWRDVVPDLRDRIAAGELPFHARIPCLLRLGWALGKDHLLSGQTRLEETVRMSNPCYGITSAFAAQAAAGVERFETTADIHLHAHTPGPGQAVSVFPPIASELSWSTGEVESLIHPKTIRASFLEAQGLPDAAAAAQAAVEAHAKHMFHRQFLVVGHPRTGTGYAAALLRQLGFDVGHEKAGADGLSSWMFAVDADRYPFAADRISSTRRTLHWETLLHVVRDPATAVASIMRDNLWSQVSYDFRRKHIARHTGVDLDEIPGNFERAVMSLVCWSKIILDMTPDLWFRLEEAHEAVPRFLSIRGLLDKESVPELDRVPVNADKPYQGVRRSKPVIRDEDWDGLSPRARADLEWYCDHFGYPCPGKAMTGQVSGDMPEPDPLVPLAQQFLLPSGWESSRRKQRPVRADGRPLPWFTYGAIEFLSRVVDGGMRVFEYGAGYSTIWWQRAALVHSVDHDPAWVAELRPEIGPNVSLQLVEQGALAPASANVPYRRYLSRPRRTRWDYPLDRVVRRGLEDDSFLAYAAAVKKSGLDYDVIVIDGMARRLCTEFAVECLERAGFIVLDNANRRDYDAAYDILSEKGFFQIPFWGLVPGANFLTCTSVFFRQTDRLPRAGFRTNSFGLPEY